MPPLLVVCETSEFQVLVPELVTGHQILLDMKHQLCQKPLLSEEPVEQEAQAQIEVQYTSRVGWTFTLSG